MTANTILVSALFSLSLAGCSSGDASSSSSSPLTTCDARYRCNGGDQAVDTQLARSSDGACKLGKIELLPDGTTTGSTDGLTWRGDTQHLSFCTTDFCVECVGLDPQTGGSAGASAKKCTGEPESCYGRGAGSCSEVAGCNFASHVKWDGSLEYTCTGSARSCESIDYEKACLRQGCEWK